MYRATKDVPFAFRTGVNTVYVEYSNLTRENVAMSLDTFISRTCNKFFKATLEDGRVVAINKDFVRRIQTRTGNKSYVYMIHTPTRYDLTESMPTIVSRLALCQGGGESGGYSLYISGDSVCITGGNCVYLPSTLPYTAGAGIDITGNVITNIGDPNPNDDVLKTTNHDGDVTGVYNNLTIKNGVVGVEKLDSAAVLTWVNTNIDVDTSNFDLTQLEEWLYSKVDTVDTDSQSLYIASDSLWITRGNGVPLDSIRGDAMPTGQRGETLWRDSTGWVVDSTIYNDGQRIGFVTDTLYNATVTVKSDIDTAALAIVSDSSFITVRPGEKLYVEPSTDLVIRESGDTLGRLLISRDSLYTASFEGYRLKVAGDFDHTSGPQYLVDIGTDGSGNVAKFNPQSGNGNFSFLRVSGELDADSAAFGQVSGILIQPVLTSYPQNLGTAYRAIDIASSGGIGVYQSGALVENRMRGNTMIGSTGRPLQTLDVSGTMRLRGSVAGPNGLLGIKLSNGDVGYVRIGTGLVMSGDTLYATATGGGDTIPDGTVLWSTLHWNGSEWVENDSLLVDPQGHGALGMPIDTLYSLNARKDLKTNSHVVGRGNGNQITNVVLGSPMGAANTAQYNTAIGREALNANLSGGNTAVGSWAVRKHNQNGGFGHNTGIGFNSLGETTTGFSNTGVGSYSFVSNTTGNFNVGVGYNAGYSESTGSLNKNTFLGAFAGSNVAAGADRNIIIGYYNFLPVASGDNQLVIGNTIFGTNVGSERDTISATGKIGIKTKTPARELHVAGELRVTNDVDTASVNKLWGSNAQGDFRRLIPGENFSISNDTLNYGLSVQETMFVVDDGMKNSPVKYQSTLTMVGTGTVTVTLDTATNTLTFNGSAADSLGNTAGEANVGMNVGAGAQVYKTKMDTTLVFRTLVDDGLTTVTQQGDTIVINTPAQTVDTFSIISDTLMLSISSDGQAAKKVALSDIAPIQSLTAGPGISLSGSADITVSATDTSVTNEIQAIDTFAIVSNVLRASLSGDGQPFKSVNLAPYLDDQIVSITGGGIASVSGTYPSFNITAVEADGLVTNEGVLGVGAGGANTATITSNTSGANAVTISGGGILAVTETTSSNGGTITLTATEVDGSVTNEIQTIDTFSISGRTVSLSLSADAQPAKTITLAADTTTVLTQDSILSYRAGGVEYARDTIALPGSAGTNFGSGTVNYYAMFSTGDTLKNGKIYESGGEHFITQTLNYGTASAPPAIGASDYTGSLSATGNGLRHETAVGTTAGNFVHFPFINTTNFNHTTGTRAIIKVNGTTVMSSGVPFYHAFEDNTTINATAGRHRSFFVSAQPEASADHRSFETVTDNSIAFLSSGNSQSRHAGNFRFGANTAPLRTVDITGTLRTSANVDTATLTRLWAGNTQGDLRRVKLGTNLSISGDTLNAAGGGVKFAETAPTFFVGANTAKDTITEMKRASLEYNNDNGTSSIDPVSNIRIKNDTVFAIRGSHFEYYENVARNKVLATNTADTLDVDGLVTKFDWATTGNGTFTQKNAPDEVAPAGYNGFTKLYVITATISLSADSIASSELAIYLDGAEILSSVAEFTAESGKKTTTVTIECQQWLYNNSNIDLRLKNAGPGSRTYTVERIRLGARHIKSAYYFNL